jgi:hypothetical protein
MEARDQKSEVRGKTEVGRRGKIEVGGKKSEEKDRGRSAADKKRDWIFKTW